MKMEVTGGMGRTDSAPTMRCLLVRENRGFTFIELILVLTIIAMLSVGVVPVFRETFHSVQDDHAVRDLVATIRYAQERAITDTTEMRLYLEPEKRQYHVARSAGMDDSGKLFKPLDERFGEAVKLPERQSLKKPDARLDRQQNAYFVSFYPNGSCDRATISIEKGDGKVVRIETNGSVGRLKVVQ